MTRIIAVVCALFVCGASFAQEAESPAIFTFAVGISCPTEEQASRMHENFEKSRHIGWSRFAIENGRYRSYRGQDGYWSLCHLVSGLSSFYVFEQRVATGKNSGIWALRMIKSYDDPLPRYVVIVFGEAPNLQGGVRFPSHKSYRKNLLADR